MRYSKTCNKISKQIGLLRAVIIKTWDWIRQSLNHYSGKLGSMASFSETLEVVVP